MKNNITDFIKTSHALYSKFIREEKYEQAQDLLDFTKQYVNRYYVMNKIDINTEKQLHETIKALAWNGAIQI